MDQQENSKSFCLKKAIFPNDDIFSTQTDSNTNNNQAINNNQGKVQRVAALPKV
jgi:hypothetical protein